MDAITMTDAVTAPLSDEDLLALHQQQAQPAPLSDGDLLALHTAAAQPEQPVRARDLFLRQMIGQGALAGFGDEGEAALRATYDKLTGGDTPWEDSYSAHLANARNMNNRFETAHPGLSDLAQVTGGIAGLAAPGPDIVDAAGWGGRALNAAAHSGLYSGAYGFGTGEGTTDRLERGGVGLGAGAALGGASVPVGEAAVNLGSKVIAPAVRSVLSPGEEAGNRLGLSIAANHRIPGLDTPERGLTDAEFTAAQNQGFPVTNMERGGENTRALADASATGSPDARAIFGKTLNDRHTAQFGQLNQTLSNMVPGGGAQGAIDDLSRQAELENTANYGTAMAHPNAQEMWPDATLTGAPDFQDAMKGAVRTSANKAATGGYFPIRHPFSVDPATDTLKLNPLTAEQAAARGVNPGDTVAPNLGFWDAVKKNLDDQYQVYARAGKKNAAGDVRDMTRKLTGYLDSQVPEYATARAGAANFIGAKDAVTAGQDLVNKNISPADAFKMRMAASPAERELTKIGIIDALRTKFGNFKDSADISNYILSNPNERARIGMFIGPDNMDTITNARNTLGLMSASKAAVQGNSKTVQRALGSGVLGATGGGLYGWETGGNPLEGASIGGVLSGAARGGLAMGGKALMRRMSVELARRLTSDDPAAINYITRGANDSPRLQNAAQWLTSPMLSYADQGGANLIGK